MKNTIYIGVLLAGLFLAGCEEYERGVPVSVHDSAPAPVTNVEVENIPGGATITYVLPNSESLLYVVAQYSRGNGVIAEKKSSYYQNSITLEGFPDEEAYQVQLFAVSRGEKKSDPVNITIQPMTPPVISVFNSLFVARGFGGIYVNFENEEEADIKINVITKDSLGDWYTAETHYTKRRSGNFSVRGFDTLAREFGVFVRDRWDNYSDTLFQEETPLFEKELNKSKFQEVHLAGDNWMPNGSKTVSKLWDGIVPQSESSAMFASKVGEGFPQSFSFDLGATATLSRLQYYPRADRQYAYTNSPRFFEIWGSNNPNPDGSWDSWTRLLECEMIKPSGEPEGTVTQEDRQFCWDGIEYEFPPQVPPVRYIRFKTLKVWSGSNISILELSFWGSEQ